MIQIKAYHKFLLYASVLILLLNIFEITIALWGIVVLLTYQSKISSKFLTLQILVLATLFIAFCSSFFYEINTHHFLRDFAYLIKPAFGLLIGYNITKIVGKETIYTVINIGVLTAFIHIFILFFCYYVFSIKNVNQLREYGGYFNDFEIYALLLVLFKGRFNLTISKKRVVLFSGILIISSLLYLSRTNMLQFGILFIALKGHLRITKRGLQRTVLFLISLASLYAYVYYLNPHRNGKGFEAFLYKVKNAPIEAFKTKINKNDWKEFNDNFRSYENIITYQQVTQEGPRAIVMGKGLGSTVDYGQKMYTNEGTYIRQAPALHNGFFTVFLKSGLLGVLLLILFVYYFSKTNSTVQKLKYFNYLFVGSALFLVLSNWVFMGLYLKLDNKSIFYGFLICYYELLLKNEENENQ